MKAFVFKPSNQPVGKFDLQTIDDVTQALMKFGEVHSIAPYYYVECSGRTWTLVSGADGLDLVEGRVMPPTQDFGASSDLKSKSDAMHRYSDAYLTASFIIGVGSFIQVVGIIFGLISAIPSFVGAANERGGDVFFFAMIGIGCILVFGFGFYITGVIAKAVGQILRATLDSAVHTSPFLNTEEKALVLKLRR